MHVSTLALVEARALAMSIVDRGESLDSMAATARRELRGVDTDSQSYGAIYLREIVRLAREGVLA